MQTPTRGALRWVRSAALAVATVGLAATAHSVAGGSVPGWPAMAVLAMPTTLVCVVLTGGRRGLVSLVSAMTLLQLALHEGFMVLTPTGCHGMLPSGHAAMHSGAPITVQTCAAAATTHSSGLSLGMLAWHGVATLLLAAALACGERALWHLRELVAPALPDRGLPAVALHRPAPARSQVVVPTAWTSVSSLVRRGPPTVDAVVPC